MRSPLLSSLGEALRARRQARGLTQPALATRIGRSPARISELEGDLLKERLSKDRLGLLVELCDALDLVPILAPRERAQAVRVLLTAGGQPLAAASRGRAFDDVFVDLSEDDDDLTDRSEQS